MPFGIERIFLENFSGAENVSWRIDNSYIRVDFTLNNVQQKAYYSYDGDLVASMRDINYGELPASVQNEISKKYKDYTVTETVQYSDTNPDDDVYVFGAPDENPAYFVELQKGNKNITLEVTDSGALNLFME
jgi:hypothetical protein